MGPSVDNAPLPAMAKAMKAMGAMKAMKAMKKKTVSKVAKGRMAKAMVLRGSKAKTVGGLAAKDLTRNKSGKIVSKKKSALGKANTWIIAVKKACCVEGQGLYRHQEGHATLPEGKGVHEVSQPTPSAWWGGPAGSASSGCGDFYSCRAA